MRKIQSTPLDYRARKSRQGRTASIGPPLRTEQRIEHPAHWASVRSMLSIYAVPHKFPTDQSKVESVAVR